MLYEAGSRRPRHPHPRAYKETTFSDVLVSVLVQKFSKIVNLERHRPRYTSGLKVLVLGRCPVLRRPGMK